MKSGRPSLLNRSTLLALVALLGLTVAVTAGSAGASSRSESAVTAKKKCKKGKKSATAAKKKCKKKAPPPAPAPTSTPPTPTPTVRATLTWNTTADLDLIVWAPDGTVAFPDANTIANSQFSPDDLDGNGPESFTDNAFIVGGSANRQFSYGACVSDDDDLDGTVATIQYKRADGSTNTITTVSGDLDDDGDATFVVPPGGFTPTENPC
jgi:hypothetical protein